MSTSSVPTPQTYNLADLFEYAVDMAGDREFLIADEKRATYKEVEKRSNRLAHYLSAQGIGAGDHVGIYALNCMEWVEAMYAIFKIRAVFININYRYVAKELSHLFQDSDIKALIYHRDFGERLPEPMKSAPALKHFIVIEDGSETSYVPQAVSYEDALAAHSEERDFAPRSSDDRYILFTGGTTGLPKGVIWRHEDVFFALGGGIDPSTGKRVTSPEELTLEASKQDNAMVFLNPAPLMHGACQWGVIGGALALRKIILISQFDAENIWRLVEQEQVLGLMITGDAMGRPLADFLETHPDKYKLDSLLVLTSTAAVFSSSLKKLFLTQLPNLMILDGVGASESGSTGMTLVGAEDINSLAPKSGGLTINAGVDTVVLDDALKVIPAGDTRIGKLARCGNIPIGYHKDAVKTAETFVVASDGKRYSIPGDFARMTEDGKITLLGRGSVCINSGGMKIFPEEVEQVLRGHPHVFDAVVVGVPSERWGEQVGAVVQLRAGQKLSLDDLQAHCAEHLASFKAPRKMVLIEKMQRSPSGKPDYPWAAKQFTDVS